MTALGLCRLRLAVFSLCLLALLKTEAAEITHFDLQQDGAAALVSMIGPNSTPCHILIDTGRASRGGRGAALVRDELSKRGIAKLDLVILTHLDADHAEGVFTLLESTQSEAQPGGGEGTSIRGPPIVIEQLLLPADTLPNHEKFRQELVTVARTAGVDVISPTPEPSLELSLNSRSPCWFPPPSQRLPMKHLS